MLPGRAGGAARACERPGFRLVVVTNQPDVARGTQTATAVEAIHAELLARGLPLDDFRVCYHDDADGCDCRKPKAGPAAGGRAGRRASISAASFMVGDRWRDVEAGRRAGCTTVFIDYGYDEPERSQPHDAACRSLAEAADWILGRTRQKAHEPESWISIP